MTNYSYGRIEGKYGIFLRNTQQYGLAFLVISAENNNFELLAVIRTTQETMSKSAKRATEILDSLVAASNSRLYKFLGVTDKEVVKTICDRFREEDKKEKQEVAPKVDIETLFDFLGKNGKKAVVLDEKPTEANNAKEAVQPEKPQTLNEEIAKLQATQKNTVTQSQIEEIMSKSVINATTVGAKTTLVNVTLPNGFVMTESSSCVDPANYNFELGKKCCLDAIKRKLWMLEGYVLQQRLYENKSNQK